MKKRIAAIFLILSLLPAPLALAQSSVESLRAGTGSPEALAAETAPFMSHNEQGRALARGMTPVPRPAAVASSPIEPQEPSWIGRLVSRLRAMLLGEAGPG